MALTKSVIPVTLATGLDTGTEPKLVSKGLLRLENGRFTRQGAISKRPGIDDLSGTYVDGYMTTFEDAPAIYNEDLYIYDSADDNFDTADKLAVMDFSVEGIHAIGESIVLQQDSAEFGNVRAVVWIGSDAGGLEHYVYTYDVNTGLLLDTMELGSTFDLGMIRVVATNTNLLYFVVGNTFDIRRGSIDVNTGKIGLHTIIDPSIPIIKATPVSRDFDACTINDDWVMLTFIGDEGIHADNAISVSMDHSGTFDAYDGYSLYTGQVANCFQFSTTSSEGALLYYDSALQATGMVVYDSSMSTVMTGMKIRRWSDANVYPTWLMGLATTDASAATIYMNTNDNNYSYPEWYKYIRVAEMTRSGMTGTVTREEEFIEGINCVSKPFGPDVDGYHYFVATPGMATGDQIQQTNFIIRNDEFVMGKFMEGTSWSSAPVGVISATNDTWRMILSNYYTDDTHGMSLVEITKEVKRQDRTAYETLEHLTFPGGICMQWDGQEATEQGFHMYPHRIDTTAQTPSGTSYLDEPSTYGYCATYEWYDAKGCKHESAPSLVDSLVVNTGKNEVEIKVPTLTMTEKGNLDVSVVLWRTEGYGSIYYRAHTEPNSMYAASITFTDTLADSTLLGRASLYTTGGILENVAPPASRVSCVHQNRLFYVNRNDESTEIRYSKEFCSRGGIAHSDSLTVSVPHVGGRITALESYLDRLIIFKKDSIYSTYGSALNNLGIGNGYADPTLLYPSVGCPNQKTIVRTPVGLMFLASDNRLYILDRSFKVSLAGKGIEYWSKNQTITSSYEEADNNEAIWLTDDGYAMVYNWEYNLWATWSNHNALDCTVADSVAYWLDPSTFAVKKHNSTYLEGSDASVTIVETGWFSFNQLEGFARVRKVVILGTMASEHILRVKIAYDFDPYWTDNETYDADSFIEIFGHEEYFGEETDNTFEDQAYMLEVSGSRQKCTSIRLQISDETVQGAGFELTAVAFEVAGKNGPIKLGADRIKS